VGNLSALDITPEALAESIETLLSDESKRQAMGRAARAAIEERFTADVMARNMTEAFSRVVRSSAPAAATVQA
jgi:glycosyltransferase involved in cell wall biosynthesis